MVSILFILVSFLVLAVSYVWIWRSNNEARFTHVKGSSMGAPMGPPEPDYNKLADQYGEVFKTRFLVWNSITCGEPEMVRYVLTNEHIFTKDFMGYKLFADMFGPEGLVTIRDVDHHKYVRNIVAQAFTYSNLKLYFPIFVEMGKRLVINWSAHSTTSAKGGDKEPVDVIHDLEMCTLDIIGRAAFGVDLNASGTNKVTSKGATHLRNLLSDSCMGLGESATDYLPYARKVTARGKKRAQAKKDLDEELVRLINRKKEGDNEKLDLLDILISAKDESGGELPMGTLSDQCVTFLVAGHETSSSALAWLLYTLAQHQDIQDKVAEEVTSKLGENAVPTPENVDTLRYLGKVVKEVQRVYPAVESLDRMCEEDHMVCGTLLIPKGTLCHIPIKRLHMSPKYWYKPEEFNPDRWDAEMINTSSSSSSSSSSPSFDDGINDNKDGQHTINAGAYLPFSLGVRNCIGSKFALLEIKALAVMLLQKFVFTLPPDHPAVKSVFEGATFKPRPYIKLNVTPRIA
eukprot:TRINITY_DN5184_c1_g1_i3.p1 TRINITY_DN5184_c1_g1~~TRINITY_DN5184_c1_g1_i3.p1  ORF type:complete len:516 (-),score=139.53 TRINITY_DN5184_c1_g1_i3:122-1669(-)